MTILHVKEQGHRCRMPFKTVPASYIKAGERLSLNGYELSYGPRQRAYNVHRDVEAYGRFDNWQFSNYICAVAKLAELGGEL